MRRERRSEERSALNACSDLLHAASCVSGCAKILDGVHLKCHGVTFSSFC